MYDVAIIGAGAAGIECAKEALKNKLSTVLIDKDEASFGGTCVNRGCIPTKLFLRNVSPQMSWSALCEKKEALLHDLKNPLRQYLTGQKLDILWGEATFLSSTRIQVKDREIEARTVIICTGSTPQTLPGFDGIPAQELFARKEIPSKILIVGAGSIGVEFASLLSGLGKEVVVVEKEKKILPGLDSSLARRLRLLLEKRGVIFKTGVDLADIDRDAFDLHIRAVGRIPNVQGLNLAAAGVVQADSGWIVTDDFFRTNVFNIWACGDVTGKYLLAYVAQRQARIAIASLCGKQVQEDSSVVPHCVFSIPQVAWVGFMESEVKAQGIRYRVLRSNFLRFSSASVYDDQEGFIQVIVGEDDRILGAAIISRFAAELINFFSVFVTLNLTVNDVRTPLFVHPTISEIVGLLFDS